MKRKPVSAPNPIPPGYVLIRPLPGGALGEVYLVQNAKTGATQVIKRLRDKALCREDQLVRFFREIASLQIARHPHIIEMNSNGEDQLGPWFAMEYCAGGDLSQYRADQGSVTLADALTITDQLLTALVKLHSLELPGLAAPHRPVRGIVHRDIKPQNMFLASRDPLHVKLADFSFAKTLALANVKGLTKSKIAAGSFQYSPRHQLGFFRDLQPDADLWSAMATMFFLLTGEPSREFSQFVRDDLVVLTRDARAIQGLRPDLPTPIASVIDAALREKKGQPPAYATARNLRRALRAAATRSGLRRKPQGGFE